MSLDQEVKDKSKEIFTDSYAMSVGEIASMYTDEELVLQPDYQRFFRWTNTQKTVFIESILLGIPIPPIFVYQREDGIWDVVDGLQRLSTIFQFMNVLRNSTDSHHEIPKLELHGTKFLPSLEGKKWESDKEESISTKLKLFFKRSRLDIKIIKYTSDTEAQFELFQRLNTGGSVLSPQEIRNSLILMEKKEFYYWFEKLNNNEDFRNCLPLTRRQIEQKEDMEFVLRFLIYRHIDVAEIKGNEDIAPFLTERMHLLLKDPNFSMQQEEEIFNKTFSFLNTTLGEDSFKKYNNDKNRFTGALSITYFEMIVPGISEVLENSPLEREGIEKFERLVKELPDDPEFAVRRKQARPITRMKELIKFSREYFDEL